MPLESLSNEQFNIHDLVIEEGSVNRSPSQFYEYLKKSPIYNKENGLWFTYLNEEGNELSDNWANQSYYTEPQMINVWVESIFSYEQAETDFAKLKETNLHLGDGRWVTDCNPDGDKTRVETGRLSDKLLALYIESLFDKQSALSKYQEIKNNKQIYHERNKQWIRSNSNPESFFVVNSYDQLIGILLEAKIDPEKARELYHQLIDYGLYDSKTGQWNESAGSVQNPTHYSYVQLMGILAEAEVDVKKAKEDYEKLKNSPLYDKKTELWNHNVQPELGQSDLSKYTIAQLLGVICESKFYDPDYSKSTPPLPEQRSY